MDEIRLLEHMVEIYSPSGQEAGLADHVAGVARRNGLAAGTDAVGNLVITTGEGFPHVMLLGHLDTVPGIIPARREHGVLWGRGVVDAKGALATFVSAAVRLAPDFPGRLTVIGTVQEEAVSSLGAQHVALRDAPDAVVIGEPSGSNGVVLGYRGCQTIEYVVTTPCGHSAVVTDNAAEIAADLWQAVRRECADRSRGASAFDSWTPRLLRLHTASDGFTERAELTFGVRTPPGAVMAAWREYLAGLAGAGELRYHEATPAVSMPKDSAIARALRLAIRRHGGQPQMKVKSGSSDMNVVAQSWNVPIVAYGPGDSHLDHTPHEHLDLDEYQTSIAILTTALTHWARQMSPERKEAPA